MGEKQRLKYTQDTIWDPFGILLKMSRPKVGVFLYGSCFPYREAGARTSRCEATLPLRVHGDKNKRIARFVLFVRVSLLVVRDHILLSVRIINLL